MMIPSESPAATPPGDGTGAAKPPGQRGWRTSSTLGKLLWPVGVFALASVVLLRPVADFDVWFVRIVGRYVLAHGAVPRHEFYLYPVMGEPSQFSAWGFGTVLELLGRLGGERAIGVFNAMLGAGTLAGLFVASGARTGAKRWMRLLVLVPLLVCLDLRLNYRPEGTLYLALGLVLVLLEGFLAGGKLALLLPIPLVAWALALLHTTPVFILFVLLAYLAEWWLRGGHPPRAKVAVSLVAIGVLALPFANPYGVEHLIVLAKSLSLPTAEVSLNIEYLPVLQTEFAPYFIGLAFLTALWLVLGPRRLPDLFLVGALGYLSFAHARNIALFSLALVLPLVRMLADSRRAASLAPARAIGAVLLCWGLATGLILRSHPWGTGLQPGIFPERAVARIREVSSGGPVFNFFHLGSYLYWQLGDRYPMLIDGHFLRESRADTLHDEVFRADPGWEELLRRDGVQVIVTPATLPFSGKMIPLVERLADHPGWSLIEVEPAAMVFVSSEVLARRGMKGLPKERIWEQTLEEVGKVLAIYPDHAKAQSSRELALLHLGRTAR